MPSTTQQIPYADLDTVRSNPENISVICPLCQKESTYNRVSDLGITGFIANQQVNCLQPECREAFYLCGDMLGLNFQLVILSCQHLIDTKDYTRCIMDLTQAHEMFFKLFLQVELVFKPFGLCDASHLNILRKLEQSLIKELKTLAFAKLRNVFMHMMVSPVQHGNLDTIYKFIGHLNDECYAKPPKVRSLPVNAKGNLNPLLNSIYRSDICTLRNTVIHSSAYHPTKEEAVFFYRETRKNVLGLAAILDLKSEMHAYRNC